MQLKMSLLDAMAVWTGCTYLSGLRRLARALEKVPIREEDLFEWNDALQYLPERGPAPVQKRPRPS